MSIPLPLSEIEKVKGQQLSCQTGNGQVAYIFQGYIDAEVLMDICLHRGQAFPMLLYASLIRALVRKHGASRHPYSHSQPKSEKLLD
jgi:hypothetical protein